MVDQLRSQASPAFGMLSACAQSARSCQISDMTNPCRFLSVMRGHLRVHARIEAVMRFNRSFCAHKAHHNRAIAMARWCEAMTWPFNDQAPLGCFLFSPAQGKPCCVAKRCLPADTCSWRCSTSCSKPAHSVQRSYATVMGFGCIAGCMCDVLRSAIGSPHAGHSMRRSTPLSVVTQMTPLGAAAALVRAYPVLCSTCHVAAPSVV